MPKPSVRVHPGIFTFANASAAVVAMLLLHACSKPEEKTGARPALPNYDKHFVPAPAMPIVPQAFQTPEPYGSYGRIINIHCGTGAVHSQVFTATADGLLTEFVFTPYLNSSVKSPAEPLRVEFWPAERPNNAVEGNPLARCVIPTDSLPKSRTNAPSTRIDLSPAQIRAKRGDQFAVVLYAGEAGTGYQGVYGVEYPGGALFEVVKEKWRELMQNKLRFQVFASSLKSDTSSTQPTDAALRLPLLDPLPSSDASSNTFIQLVNSPRFIIAEHSPKNNAPIAVAQQPSTVAGSWQVSAVPFEQDGDWYFEFRFFNGTNAFRPNSPQLSGQIPSGAGHALTVQLIRKGDPAPRNIFPVPSQRTAFDGRNLYAGMQSFIPPGTGYIRHFQLSDKASPLAPGEYTLNITMPMYLQSAVQVPFVVR